MRMSHELVVAVLEAIVIIKKLLCSSYSNLSSREFKVQDFGLALENAPKIPDPLPLMHISELLFKGPTSSIAPPELYMFSNPIGAN